MSADAGARARRFALRELYPEPWRNGGGLTRTVARGGLPGSIGWRVSAADIVCNSSFSRFDGQDREAVMIAGDGLTLCSEFHSFVLARLGDTARFPGEQAIEARLQGSSARLLNIMFDRTRFTATVTVSREPVLKVVQASEGVLLVLAGACKATVAGEMVALHAEDGLIFDNPTHPIALKFNHGSALWALATFHPR